MKLTIDLHLHAEPDRPRETENDAERIVALASEGAEGWVASLVARARAEGLEVTVNREQVT